MLVRNGTNHLEVYLKRGNYVLQFKERTRPTVAFKITGQVTGMDFPKVFKLDYMPSETRDGSMVVFEMSRDAYAVIDVIFESEDHTRAVYLSLGPHQ